MLFPENSKLHGESGQTGLSLIFKTKDRFNKNKMVQLFGKKGDCLCKNCKSLAFVYRYTSDGAKRQYRCKKRLKVYRIGITHRLRYEACKLFEEK